MVAGNLGFAPLDAFQILLIILGVMIVLIIPGYLISLALFPRKEHVSMTERVTLSLPLGLTPPFGLMILHFMVPAVKFSFVSGAIMVVVLAILSLLAFYKRGGELTLNGILMKG